MATVRLIEGVRLIQVSLYISPNEVIAFCLHLMNKLQGNLNKIRLLFGTCDGISTVGGGVRMAGFKGGGVKLTVVGFARWPPVLAQVLCLRG